MSGRHFLTAFRQLASLRCPAAAAATTVTTITAQGRCCLKTSTSIYTPAAYSRLSQHQHRRLLYQHSKHRSYSTAAAIKTPDHTHTYNDGDGQIGSKALPKKERVLLLMSGGVDSSMCAHILHSQGYEVTGLYMHNWNHDEETQDELETPTNASTTLQLNTPYLTESTPDTTTLLTATDHGYKPMPRTAPIRPKACTSDRDWADVQSVCSQIGIPARRLDFSRQYWNQVFQVMLQEYERGRTPNPDVSCNREIKFGELVEWCRRNGGLGKDRGGAGGGWDYLATGHYARVERDPETGIARLLRAKDSNKDQTYYLSTLSEKVLRHVLFPLAQYDKPTVKRMALAFASSSTTSSSTNSEQDEELTSLQYAALKKESMGICFVGQRKRFGDFLKEYLDPLPGPVKINGLGSEVIGMHKGLFQYTVGQASGVTHKHNKWVVLRTDLPSNTLVVVDGTQNDRLFSPGLIAEDWHWIAGAPPKKLVQRFSTATTTPTATNGQDEQDDEYPFTAQIRHRQVPQPCTIEPISEAEAEQSATGTAAVTTATTTAAAVEDISSARLFRVRFKDHQRAIAPGQILVLYDRNECLGGAVIRSSLLRPEYAHEHDISSLQP